MNIVHKFGFSLYASSPLRKNKELLERFSKNNFTFVFTSLNIKEEAVKEAEMIELLKLCLAKNLYLIVDINKTSFEKYTLDRLKDLGISALRIDDGISFREIKKLSSHFDIVLNASTLREEELRNLIFSEQIPPEKLIACHNYYPKEYTGLSLEKLKEKNEMFNKYNIKTITFIAGEEKRMPIFSGLPTVEVHRYKRPIYAALDSLITGKSSAICIADIDIEDKSLFDLKSLQDNIINIRANVDSYIKKFIYENRIDASDFLIRASYSRIQLKDYPLEIKTSMPRTIGGIFIANQKYARYEKELEICLVNLPQDERQSFIGKVETEDIELLKFINYPYKFRFT